MTNLPKLAAPAQRALQNAGITNLEHLTKISETELLRLAWHGTQCAWSVAAGIG